MGMLFSVYLSFEFLAVCGECDGGGCVSDSGRSSGIGGVVTAGTIGAVGCVDRIGGSSSSSRSAAAAGVFIGIVGGVEFNKTPMNGCFPHILDSVPPAFFPGVRYRNQSCFFLQPRS